MRLPWILCPHCGVAIDPPDDVRLGATAEARTQVMQVQLHVHMKKHAGAKPRRPEGRMSAGKAKAKVAKAEARVKDLEAQQEELRRQADADLRKVGEAAGRFVGTLLQQLMKGK